MSYEPRGKMVDLIAAMRAAPARVFKAEEVASVLCCKNYPSTIDQYVYAAIASGLVFKRRLDGAWYYAGSAVSDELLKTNGIEVPLSGSGTGPRLMPSPSYSAKEIEAARTDVRAPKVDPAWTPPKMSPPRGETPRVESRETIWPPAATPQPTQAPAPAGMEWPSVPADPPLPEEVETVDLTEVEDEEPAQEFDAAIWINGDLDLYGVIELEGGGCRILAKDVQRLRQRLAWLGDAMLIGGGR
jgi:hypothetical protein